MYVRTHLQSADGHKNETKGPGMIDIKEMHDYLGDTSKIRPSGGDYLTVERQWFSKQHMMDSASRKTARSSRALRRRLALSDEFPTGKKYVTFVHTTPTSSSC